MSEFFPGIVFKIATVFSHPNADKLEIINAFGNENDMLSGYPSIVQKDVFKAGDLAVFLSVDCLVDTQKPEFSFLRHSRISAKRLRGTYSEGLILKVPEGMIVEEGQSLQEHYGIQKYDAFKAKHRSAGGKIFAAMAIPDPVTVPKYDLEGVLRYKNLLIEGEEVVLKEKIHGCNFKAVYTKEGIFSCGSRSFFRKEPQEGKTCDFNDMAVKYNLQEKLQKHPNKVFFAEMYGKTQCLQYGKTENELAFFDIFDADEQRFLNYDELTTILQELQLPEPPEIYRGPFSFSKFQEFLDMAEGQSLIPGANNIREGWVLRPMQESFGLDPKSRNKIRLTLKMVGKTYKMM